MQPRVQFCFFHLQMKSMLSPHTIYIDIQVKEKDVKRTVQASLHWFHIEPEGSTFLC